MLNFKDSNVNGTDIKIWGPYKKNRALPFNFKFILENGNLDYPDNYSNQEYYHYKSTVFTKKVTFGSLSSFYSAINPTLLEIKAFFRCAAALNL